jgi:hypothetical protein
VEKPSSNFQIAVSLLVGIIVLRLLEISVITAPFRGQLEVGAISLVALFTTLAFIFLPLLWWQHTAGYIGTLLVGVLNVIGLLGAAIIEVGGGTMPVEMLFYIVPGIIISLLLILYAYLAWRE